MQPLRARKTIVAYYDGINALLSARCFPFLRFPASAIGGGQLRRPRGNMNHIAAFAV